MQYTQVTLSAEANHSTLALCRDLLIDALGNEGPYDSFEETSTGLKAYVPTTQFDPGWLQQQIDGVQVLFPDFHCQVDTETLPDKDWNEEWERQYPPVVIEASDGQPLVSIHAPFHAPNPNAQYDIIIDPKMSFGTAHHPTTRLMLCYLASLPLQGKRVLDMGCGTAVLSIMAYKRGAAYVEAIDVDEWAYRNAIENVEKNQAQVTVRIGNADLLRHPSTQPSPLPFHLIAANINRNILLADMDAYASVLSPNGTLLLSGFYTADIPALQSCAERLGLYLTDTQTQDDWAALRLEKHT